MHINNFNTHDGLVWKYLMLFLSEEKYTAVYAVAYSISEYVHSLNSGKFHVLEVG